MKLYKADISNQIGNKVITVPTDSQFLVGLTYFDPEATIKLFDGDTEIEPEEDKINAYTCYRFSTGGTPFRKTYTAVITSDNYTKVLPILVICAKMSVAYRDMEGGGSSVEIVTSIDASSTDTQVPSAKCVYDLVGDVETLINNI